MTAVQVRYEAEPLFGSTHQALMFAYTYSANQHAVAGAAERMIAMFARDRYGADAVELAQSMVRRGGRGLIGLDGAAQAAMILAHVGRMPAQRQVFLTARFELFHVERRRVSLKTIVLGSRSTSDTLDLDLVSRLVLLHFGVTAERLIDIVERWQNVVPERTLYRHWSAIRKWLKQHEQLAVSDIEQRLAASGLIEGV